ncbi:voltage-dependent calcium channel gamma-6 subunit [Scleropages formosus]|uniref:Calcium channel, voltage-dependent, gamma subunit 6a n=1 Tax=Scleropages formosus TaxID=113540 RepID=A0A8C9QPY0_SCLFO|nr:voltage-dependent calcium channel gamma-6 subunit [Scleropages formosus]
MWSNFFMQEEEGRAAAAGVGGAGGGAGGHTGAKGVRGGTGKRRTGKPQMSDSQEGKIKLAFFVAIVGVTLTVLGVGTEFWVELAPPKTFFDNKTCQAAHYGLWKGCVRTLRVSDIDPDRESCGPAELPGESNCTYFKFFTSGDNAVIFKRTTTKSLNIAAAVLALVSLFMMIMGSVCIIMSLSKGVQFFLKPASFCFTLSGILVMLTLIVFHQSVLALLDSDHSMPLQHELSWSVACVGSAGAILIVGGVIFLMLFLPYSPWEKCFPHRSSAT